MIIIVTLNSFMSFLKVFLIYCYDRNQHCVVHSLLVALLIIFCCISIIKSYCSYCAGVVPETRHVRGSNHCFMNVFPDRVGSRAIIIAVIDNLGKGAAGQAIQVQRCTNYICTCI